MPDGTAPKRRQLLALLALVPALLIGPSILAGDLFLPQVPAALEPFRSENPAAAELAREGQNYTQSDRLLPALTDQRAMRDAVLDGELPAWEPLLGFGIPLFAQSIAGAAYPPNWLALLVPPERAAAPLAVLSLLLAGLGAWLFLGRLGLSAGARITGALAFQLGGWGVGNLFLYMKLDAALWLPWALWAVEGIARSKRWSGAALSVALAASILAGMPQVGALVCALTALYAALRLTPLARLFGLDDVAQDGARIEARVPPLVAGAVFGALGAAGAALLVLPMVEASRQSLRQRSTPEVMASQALPLTTLAGTVLHDFAGAPTEPSPTGRLPVAWWITPADEYDAAFGANALEWNAYAGAAVIALCLVGWIASPKRAVLPTLLLLLALGYAQGWPGLRWLYRLPGLDVGVPGRGLALTWFLWPWLAAVGVEALTRERARATRTLIAAGLVLFTAAAVFYARLDPVDWASGLDELLIDRYEELRAPGDVRRQFSSAEAVASGERLAHSGLVLMASAAGVALAGAAGLALGRRRPAARWVPIALIVLIEGLVASDGHADGRHVDGELFPPSPTIEAIRAAAGEGRVIRYDSSASGVADVENLARPNLLQMYGIADLTPWIVFPPRLFNEFFAALDPASRHNQGVSRVSDVAVLDHPMLDLARASAILSREPLEHPRLEPVLERPGFCVYHRTGAFGPARVVPAATHAPTDQAALEAMAGRLIDFRSRTLLAPGSAERAAAVEDASAGHIASFERPTRASIRVHVEDAQGGWLVVHEQFHPGWSASLNGEPTPIVRADHAYQAVALAPGDNVVELRYEARSLTSGFLISAGAIALAFLLSWRLAV